MPPEAPNRLKPLGVVHNNFMEYTKEQGLDYQQAYRARIRAGKQLLKKNIIDKKYLKREADSIFLRTAPA